MIKLEAEHVAEVFTAFGRLGVRAEDVAGPRIHAPGRAFQQTAATAED
jgi:hypothetical protein